MLYTSGFTAIYHFYICGLNNTTVKKTAKRKLKKNSLVVQIFILVIHDQCKGTKNNTKDGAGVKITHWKIACIRQIPSSHRNAASEFKTGISYLKNKTIRKYCWRKWQDLHVCTIYGATWCWIHKTFNFDKLQHI